MSGVAENADPVRSPVLPLWKRRFVALAGIAVVALFISLIARFYDPETGLTNLLSIGDKTEAGAVSKLREVPHHVYRDSYGYDGAYYVQIALSPLLNDPELPRAIDNLPYRARRIFLSWTAWALGGGEPAAIVMVFPFLNVATWLALAAVLLRWFPLTTWDNLLRWSTLMFSHGVCMSVRHSLVDAPSLLLIALAVVAVERKRPLGAAAALSLAALTRETSVLGSVIFKRPDPGLRGWLKLAALVTLVALPLAGWLFYLRQKFGLISGVGFNNFTLPLAGLAEKWGESVAGIFGERVWDRDWATLACTISLTVQCVFLLVRWQPAQAWWRVGVMFAVMALFLSRPVWEGTPGAATRVLLPMAVAFNLLVPRGRRWLALLVAGNLTVFASVAEFRPPPRFYTLSASSDIVAKLKIEATGDWYGVEGRGSATWRWASDDAALLIDNQGPTPLTATFRGSVSSLQPGRQIEIQIGSETLWSAKLERGAVPFSVTCALPAGQTSIRFETDLPIPLPDADGRRLAFSVSNLKLTVAPAATTAP